jgi:hypothetical protein
MRIPPTTLPPNPDELEKKLAFAREIANEEIKNIERLHDRTIRALTVLMAGFSLVGILIGFIGFNNLRDFAVATATNKMNETITSLMDEKQVVPLVNGLIAENATEAINKQVSQEIKRLGPEIQKAAVAEAKRMITEPRHLSQGQRDAMTSASKTSQGQKVNVRAYSEDPEEKHYASEIRDALEHAGWKAFLDSPSAGWGSPTILPNATGLFIAVRESQPQPATTLALQKALQAAELTVPILPAKSFRDYPDGPDAKPGERVPVLIVSSKF